MNLTIKMLEHDLEYEKEQRRLDNEKALKSEQYSQERIKGYIKLLGESHLAKLYEIEKNMAELNKKFDLLLTKLSPSQQKEEEEEEKVGKQNISIRETIGIH